MRVRFRIAAYVGDKRLSKRDLDGERDPLLIGIRYLLEFKYLEANKWILLAEDCWEKYVILGLTNIALGQEDQAEEFLSQADRHTRKTDLRIVVEKPEKGLRKEIRSAADVYTVQNL